MLVQEHREVLKKTIIPAFLHTPVLFPLFFHTLVICTYLFNTRISIGLKDVLLSFIASSFLRTLWWLCHRESFDDHFYLVYVKIRYWSLFPLDKKSVCANKGPSSCDITGKGSGCAKKRELLLFWTPPWWMLHVADGPWLLFCSYQLASSCFVYPSYE